jgi:hypothetical protein
MTSIWRYLGGVAFLATVGSNFQKSVSCISGKSVILFK